jgi:hypothetical protein
MELNPEIFKNMSEINWFNNCGMEPPDDLPFHIQRSIDISSAISTALDPDWQNAGTAAQGDLSGYLAGHHYDSYGGHWNNLSRKSHEIIKSEIMPKVEEALINISADELLDIVLLDLNRIAIHSIYKKHYKRIPDFYERLLKVYKSGHLPCGWIGDFDLWPEGKLVVY